MAASNPLDEWLPRVAADPIHVDEGPRGLLAEARANMWGLGFTDDELRGVTEEDVVRFLRAVEEARGRQIPERFGAGHPMVFYAWADAQAGELRLSLVSASHEEFAFEGPLEIVGDPAEVAREYLERVEHGGIPLGEFRESTHADLDADAPLPRLTKVWTSALPKQGA